MAQADLLAGHRALRRYLLDGERVIAAVHQHWAKVAEPVASAIGGLVLVLWLDTAIGGRAGWLSNLLWWAWFFAVARAVWKLLEWRHDWFVATDKRLILTYGLVTSKVAMMPLAKVTDMSYNRSPMGRLLGYGMFVMESAGQDQALRNVNWVPDPDHTYRAICAEMFQVDDRDRVGDRDGMTGGEDAVRPPGPRGGGPRDDDTPPHGTPSRGTPPSAAPRQAPLVDYGRPGGPADYSTPIRVRPARQDDEYRDALDQSPDLSERGIRDADTGPIPLWRPSAGG